MDEQLFFTLPEGVYKYLTCSYYDLDPRIARYFIGKKLSSKLKKQLLSLHYRIPISNRKCRRIYDNLKRIYKVVEAHSNDPVKLITNKFNLTKELSGYLSELNFCIYLTRCRIGDT